MTPFLATWWTLWFAWYPVYVDAYGTSDIRNGQMRYRVWLQTVEYSHQIFIDDDNSRTPIYRIRYRMPQPASEGE